METRQHYKIVIMEDNDFYNKIVSRYLKNYLDNLALSKGFTFDMQSFTSYDDFARNFTTDTTVVLTDYYLNDGYNALHVLEQVRKLDSSAKVVVLSQMQNMFTSIYPLLEGACEFIHKDKKALEKSAYVIEEIISEKMKENLGSGSAGGN